MVPFSLSLLFFLSSLRIVLGDEDLDRESDGEGEGEADLFGGTKPSSCIVGFPDAIGRRR